MKEPVLMHTMLLKLSCSRFCSQGSNVSAHKSSSLLSCHNVAYSKSTCIYGFKRTSNQHNLQLVQRIASPAQSCGEEVVVPVFKARKRKKQVI
jgi:hypothetical protein